MKRLLIICLLSFLLLGCNSYDINLNSNDFIDVKYNDITIISTDYPNITSIINKIDFDKVKIDDTFDNNLVIITSNDIFNFYISTNNNIKYKNSSDTYYSSDSDNIQELVNYLNEISSKYSNNNFYSIDYINDYEISNDDLFIKLDSHSNLLIINSTIDIFNFKIHTIEFSNEKYNDTNLLYDNDYIPSNKNIIIRKTINNPISDIRISFESPYNYIVSLIPKYDSNNSNVIFLTDFRAKENP
jgi:hypothetical protein